VLLLPTPRGRRLRVLLLGLGGGSVAQAVRALAPDVHVVGVERDAEVLRLARRHFGLDRVGVELVQGDALAYLRRERRKFDLVVEDLFEGKPRNVRKPAWLLGEGYPLVRRRLRPSGLAVSNTIHEMKAVVRAMRRFGGRIVSLDVRGHWNRIVVVGRSLQPPRALRLRLLASPVAFLVRRLAIRSR
jgi:spermidine synthase